MQAGATEPATPPATTWASSDIGSPAVAGSFSVASGTYAISGAGDVNGTADRFRFAYQAVQGDVEIIARLATFHGPDPWAKTGVMIRQSLDSSAPHGLMVESAQNGFAFQRRLIAGGTTYTSQGSQFQGPAWVRLVREGNLLTAYESLNGTAWTLVGTDTVAMSGTIYVGLAISSRLTSTLASATFTNVTVRTPTPGANQPPSVTLTAPTAGATYTAPATISFSASASDGDGTISRVDFYRGTTLVTSDTASPYTTSWTNAPAGTYSLTAVAYDNEGASTTSPAVERDRQRSELGGAVGRLRQPGRRCNLHRAGIDSDSGLGQRRRRLDSPGRSLRGVDAPQVRHHESLFGQLDERGRGHLHR